MFTYVRDEMPQHTTRLGFLIHDVSRMAEELRLYWLEIGVSIEGRDELIELIESRIQAARKSL